MQKSLQNLEEELDMFTETIMITVQRKDLQKAVHGLRWQAEEWSNQSCLGYVIKGLEDAGLSGEDVEHLVRFVRRTFDETSLKQAQDIYCQSRY